MARIICVANQKGGVGKTTTAVNLVAALAKSGRRSLLIDLDPQCNATGALGLAPAPRQPLLSPEPLATLMQPTSQSLLTVVPGTRNVEEIQRLAAGDAATRRLLLERIESTQDSHDFVIVDCPPSLGALTQTALLAATEVLMPIQCEFFAMEGLTQMIEVIREVMYTGSGKLDFGGILLTMYDPALELTEEVDAEVRDFFGDVVFDTVIPRDVAVAEAPSHGVSVIDYAPRSRGTLAYIELCMEVLARDYE